MDLAGNDTDKQLRKHTGTTKYEVLPDRLFALELHCYGFGRDQMSAFITHYFQINFHECELLCHA